jgi:hypothetical protein
MLWQTKHRRPRRHNRANEVAAAERPAQGERHENALVEETMANRPIKQLFDERRPTRALRRKSRPPIASNTRFISHWPAPSV